jgi:molecular chaperone DnaJ
MADFYSILGVDRRFSPTKLRRAYQRRAREFHPDLHPGSAEAASMFALVAQAFEVLSDPERRSAYDRGVVEGKTLREKPPLAFEGFDFAPGSGGRQGFRELFESAIEPEGQTAQAGEDLEVTLRISFDEAFRGAHRRLSVTRLSPCATCDGSGHVARAAEPCATCGGEGSTRVRRGHLVFRARCRDCDGAGQRVQGPCPTCAGESRVHETEWMDINVPPGIEHGTRLRLPSAGNAGRRGGAPGDFLVHVEVDPHPLYRRAGHDLYVDAPVSIFDAAMGGHVSVQTPDGDVPIEIPAGTHGAQRFRLRKRGMPHFGDPGSRGDLWAEVKLMVPAVTDAQSRALLAEVSRRVAEAEANNHPETRGH